jgi:hypothetical protein
MLGLGTGQVNESLEAGLTAKGAGKSRSHSSPRNMEAAGITEKKMIQASDPLRCAELRHACKHFMASATGCQSSTPRSISLFRQRSLIHETLIDRFRELYQPWLARRIEPGKQRLQVAL